MKKFFLLMLVTVLLSACSKEEEKEANVLRALVKETNDNTILIESMESIYSGEIIIPKQEKIKNGDKIDVYYNGEINPGSPGEIFEVLKVEVIQSTETPTNQSSNDSNFNKSKDTSKENEQNSKNKDEKESNKEQSKYYDYPILTMKKSDSEIELRENDSALIRELIDMVEWESGIKEKSSDYIITDEDGEHLEYNSKTGTLNDIKNDIHVELHPELQEVLMLALTGAL